jgi:exosortase D (VPLPA-CTERM-specific)
MTLAKAKISLGLQLALGTVLAWAILWFYWPTLVNLAQTLISNEDYSFGLLVPLVVAYIVYLKWPQIRRGPWQPSWMGLAIIAFGFGLYIFGDLVAFLYLPTISFIVVVAGLLYLLGSRRIVRLFGFPLLLLALIVPPPSVLMTQLTFNLQLISSSLAAWLLQLAGFPCVRQGNVIDLGVRQLQVVGACSGLRYILSLIALGMIYCYFYQRRPWKIVILFFCLVPSAIIANAVRVTAMGIFPVLQQEGFWHNFSGWLIFLFAFGVLALIDLGLNYLRPDSSSSRTLDTPTKGEVFPDRSSRPSHIPFLAATLILVILGHFGASKFHASPTSLIQSFDNFPMELGPWRGQRSYLDAAMAKQVGADDYLDANFLNPQEIPVSLWIAYFASQTGKIEGRIHSPLSCLPGAGWKILESKRQEVSSTLSVRYLLMEQNGARQIVYYWFIQGGRWLTNEYSLKFFMGYDGLLRRRNNAALIRLITPVGSSIESAEKRLTSFVHLLSPILPQFIPN